MKAAKNATKIKKFGLAFFFVGEEGTSPLKIINCQVFLICPTPSPSRGGATPISHPRDPPQSPKATIIATEITRLPQLSCFVGNGGNSPPKPSNFRPLQFVLPRHPTGWRITHMSLQGSPSQPQATRNTTEITIFGSAIYFVG